MPAMLLPGIGTRTANAIATKTQTGPRTRLGRDRQALIYIAAVERYGLVINRVIVGGICMLLPRLMEPAPKLSPGPFFRAAKCQVLG